MSEHAHGMQAAAIRCYLLDHPKARTVDVAKKLGCTKTAVSTQKKTLGIKPPRWHEAHKRRIAPRDLDKLILSVVYETGLVSAVLDDEK
jgi:hypothetical protein